jgi:N-6 DNA Methylase
VNIEDRDLVTAAWIARHLGVSRAAVANWRKRYPDFPQPVAEGTLFSWSAVHQWLVETGKADQLAATGRTTTGTHLIGDDQQAAVLDRDLTTLVPPELLARVLASLLPRLEDNTMWDDEPPVILDPACRDSLVLRAVAERFADHVRLAGQAPTEIDATAVRATLTEYDIDVQVGEALRLDRFTPATAHAVICLPPPARQWPAAELAADPRWRYGLPEPTDPELAWVQHCLAHLQPRGVAVVATSPVTGVRPSGRHVRAALVRAGVLRDVIALPEGLTPAGEGSLYLWVLQRGSTGRDVRMIDLAPLADPADVPSSHAGWEQLFASDDPSVIRTVPHLELLDGDVPLTPSRYLRHHPGDSAQDLEAFTHRLRRLYARVGDVLLSPEPTPVTARRPEVTLAELERSRALTILPRDATPRKGDVLFRTMGRVPVVATGRPEDEGGVAQVIGVDLERLDPHFLATFVRADALAAPVTNTSAALTREDIRRCRVPRLTLAEQQRYGDEFRRLQELDELAGRLARVTQAVVAQTVHGLTTGALTPSTTKVRETTHPETDENGKMAK